MTSARGFTPYPECLDRKVRDEWYRARSENAKCPKHKLVGTGFTLLEMLVTMAMMATIMTIILFNGGEFNRQIAMNRSARALAFGLRDAQSRSVNVSQVACNPAPCFPPNFGLYVSKTAGNNQFILFTDRDPDGAGPLGPNGVYDSSGTCGGATDECVTENLFTNGVTVNELLAPTVIPNPCPPSISYAHDALSIIFYRPDPTVKIRNQDGCSLILNVTGPFRLFIKHPSVSGSCSPNELTPTPGCKAIRLWLTGQISIEQ